MFLGEKDCLGNDVLLYSLVINYLEKKPYLIMVSMLLGKIGYLGNRRFGTLVMMYACVLLIEIFFLKQLRAS